MIIEIIKMAIGSLGILSFGLYFFITLKGIDKNKKAKMKKKNIKNRIIHQPKGEKIIHNTELLSVEVENKDKITSFLETEYLENEKEAVEEGTEYLEHENKTVEEGTEYLEHENETVEEGTEYLKGENQNLNEKTEYLNESNECLEEKTDYLEEVAYSRNKTELLEEYDSFDREKNQTELLR